MTSNPSSIPPAPQARGPYAGWPEATVAKLADVVSSPFDDPLRLAKEYLYHEHLTASGELRLHFYREEWHRWDGLAWRALDALLLRSQITEFIHARLRELCGVGSLLKLPRMSTKLVNSTQEFLQGLCIIPREREWFSRLDGGTAADHNYVSFLNGILHVPSYLQGSAEAFQPHTPQWFSPTHLNFPFLPEADCPVWLRFLSQVLGDDDSAAPLLVQELFGYCLTPDTSHEKFFLLSGAGRNGKSTIINLLCELVGEKNVSHIALENFADRFSPAATVGKLINTMTECGRVPQGVEAVFKKYVSGEPFDVERKFADPFTFRPTARCIFAANSLPAISDHSDGFWRRLVLLPFKFQVAEADKDMTLGAKLRDELPGIALWALRGLERLRQQGAFTSPESCATALREYREAGNPLGTWLKETYVADPDGEVVLKHVLAGYRAAIMSEDKTLKEPSASETLAELSRLFPRSRSVRKNVVMEEGKVRVVKGVRLVEGAPKGT